MCTCVGSWAASAASAAVLAALAASETAVVDAAPLENGLKVKKH